MPRVSHIRTDTADDTIASFELASVFLRAAQSDARYWKWFVIACHAGVQGVFALVLECGNGLLVQKPGVMKRTLQAFSEGAAVPEPHMDNFTRLYEKVQSRQNLRSSAVDPVVPTPELDAAISSLDKLRDEFLHFNVKGWSIELDLIRSSARQCIGIAWFLVRQSAAVLWHEAQHEERAKSALLLLEKQLA
jgi:hypothetical protein